MSTEQSSFQRPPLPPPGPPLEHLDSGSTVYTHTEVIEVPPRQQVGDLSVQKVIVLCPQRIPARNHK